MFLCLYLDTGRGLTWENLGSNCFQFPDGCPKYPTPKLPVAVFFLFLERMLKDLNLAKLQKLHFLKAILNHYVHGEIP